jgi:TolA-binding protein
LRQVVPLAARKEYEVGLKFVSKGNITQAADHFQQAVSLYPEYLAARNDLGAQYLKLKRVDEAERLFQQCSRKIPRTSMQNSTSVGTHRTEELSRGDFRFKTGDNDR